MKPHKLLLLLMLGVLLLLAVLIWFYPPTGDFRATNPFWNGLTVFTAQFKPTLIESFNNLPLTPKGTTLIVIPYTPFTEMELEGIRKYVSLGGTLMILDDYGYGNQILSHLGLNVKFAGKPLLDPLFNYKNKWFPRITEFASASITSDVESIVLNHASGLRNISDATVIAWSSRFSFLDLNGDSMWSQGEPVGPLPVAAYVRVGAGYVVIVADPSILINGMINRDDNLVFIESVMRFQDSNPKVFVDQLHLPKTSLDEAKATILAVYRSASSPIGTLSLTVIILMLALNPIWRRK